MNEIITVIGSSNTGMVVTPVRLPARGETVIRGDFGMYSGGKGANQAVAAARLGGEVYFVDKKDNNIFEQQTSALLANEGINTAHFSTDSNLPSGVALISVDDKAENCVVVASGANSFLSPNNIDSFAPLLLRSLCVKYIGHGNNITD